MAFVRGVMAFSIFAGSMRNVSGSMSTNTGTAMLWRMHVALVGHVYEVTMTWSPAPTPQPARHICNALPPQLVKYANLFSLNSQNSSSSFFV